jgi:hypothetical protein
MTYSLFEWVKENLDTLLGRFLNFKWIEGNILCSS